MSNDLATMSRDDLKKQLLVEQDPERIKELLNVFNMNLRKQEAIRTDQLSDLQDKVIDQMSKRINERPDNFSNGDLINFHKTIQDSIDKNCNSLDTSNLPQIQVNQQINIDNTVSLNRESRKKVMDAVNAILSKAQNTEEIIDIDQEQEDSGLQQED